MDVITICTLVLAIVAIFGLFINAAALKQSNQNLKQSQDQFIAEMKADHLQRRKEVALAVSRRWDDKVDNGTRERIAELTKWFRNEGDNEKKVKWVKFFSEGLRVSEGELKNAVMSHKMKEIFHRTENFSLKELNTYRNTIIAVLDAMEEVAVAHKQATADRDTLNPLFKPVIPKAVKDLQPFIDEIRDASKSPDCWKPLTELVYSGDWQEVTKAYEPGKSADDQALEEITN